MHPSSKSFLRGALAALALLGVAATTATARPRPFHASFVDTWLSSPVLDSQGFLGLQLDIAAAGPVSEMICLPVMLTNNHTIKFRPSAQILPELQPREVAPGTFVPAGAGTYTIRDRRGDSLVVYMAMEQQPVGADGILRFSGAWSVLSGTGRYANATGGGTWTGWAKPDDPVALMTTGIAGGAGGADMHGEVDLHEAPASHGRH